MFSCFRNGKKDDRGPGSTIHWRCTVRASRQQRLNGGITCTASVMEKDGMFRRGETPHCHPPKEDLYARQIIGKMVSGVHLLPCIRFLFQHSFCRTPYSTSTPYLITVVLARTKACSVAVYWAGKVCALGSNRASG